jgi:excisionase family DNA binding protein
MAATTNMQTDAIGTAEILLTIAETASLLRCHTDTVRTLISSGSLPFVRIRRLLFVRRSSLLAWLERQERRGNPATTRPHPFSSAAKH